MYSLDKNDNNRSRVCGTCILRITPLISCVIKFTLNILFSTVDWEICARIFIFAYIRELNTSRIQNIRVIFFTFCHGNSRNFPKPGRTKKLLTYIPDLVITVGDLFTLNDNDHIITKSTFYIPEPLKGLFNAYSTCNFAAVFILNSNLRLVSTHYRKEQFTECKKNRYTVLQFSLPSIYGDFT